MNFLHLPSFYRILSTQQKKWTYSTKTGMPGHIFYLQMILPTKMIKRNIWRMILRGRISSSLPHLHPLHPGGTRSQNLQKYRNISGNMRLNLTGCKFWDVIFFFFAIFTMFWLPFTFLSTFLLTSKPCELNHSVIYRRSFLISHHTKGYTKSQHSPIFHLFVVLLKGKVTEDDNITLKFSCRYSP